MTARSRVLYPFTGDTVGGSHISTLELVRGLDRTRYDPVVAVHEDGVLADYLRERNIEPAFLPSVRFAGYGKTIIREVGSAILAAPRLGRFLRRREVDLVHTNDTRMNILWALAAKRGGAKHVWHQRSIARSRRFHLYWRLPDAIVTISRFTRKAISEPLANKTYVVANPVRGGASQADAERCRMQIADATAVSQPETVVSFVANLTPRKRVDVFIAMAGLLSERDGDRLAFPIFGDNRENQDKAVEARISAAGLASCCVLMGPQFPIDPWMVASDVLVAPAVEEPFGRTLVEAMLCGTPVVAADSGGHREIVRHEETGLLVPPDDPKAFADAVSRLIEDPALATRLATTARTEASERYSVEAHVEQIQDIYDAVLR